MPRLDIPLGGGSYESDSAMLADMMCINWSVHVPEVEGALSSVCLFGSAGISEILSTGEIQQVNRGGHVKDGKPYFLNGTTLYRIDSSFDTNGIEVFTPVTLGSISGEDRVSMADNGKQLLILVPNGTGYIIDETSGTPFVAITDPDFTANGAPQMVTFVDSFFICTTDTKKFIKSASNDGLNWNALDFGSAESDPDGIVAPIVHNNKLFIAGSETIEEFGNTGLGGFNFQRTGFFLNKGVFSPFSLINVSSTFMFIGGGSNESPSIWALSGGGVQKVSNLAIDSALQKFSKLEISQAFSYTYAQSGDQFVGFSLPTKTFEFNITSGKWGERESQILTVRGANETVRWRANSVVTAYNKVLCGDSQDGRIGAIDVNTYSEYNEEIIRTVSVQPLADLGNSITISQLEATFESGVGDLSTLDPKINLSISKDGKCFSNYSTRSLGGIGQYNKRSVWSRLGRFPRFAIFKFTMSDKVKARFLKLEMNIRSSTRGN